MAAITPLYAFLCALIFLALSAQVILYRRRNLVSLGDNGDKKLLQLMRAQANCAEYAPFGLLLLLIAEAGGQPPWALHLTGILLVAGRAIHAAGFSRSHLALVPRTIGMVMTLTALILGAVLCGLTAFGL